MNAKIVLLIVPLVFSVLSFGHLHAQFPVSNADITAATTPDNSVVNIRVKITMGTDTNINLSKFEFVDDTGAVKGSYNIAPPDGHDYSSNTSQTYASISIPAGATKVRVYFAGTPSGSGGANQPSSSLTITEGYQDPCEGEGECDCTSEDEDCVGEDCEDVGGCGHEECHCVPN